MKHHLLYALIILCHLAGCTTGPSAAVSASEPTAPDTPQTVAAPIPASPASAVLSADCYDYLTELVRSSDFTFGDADPRRVNLLIDNDAGETISARLVPADKKVLFVDGWVSYNTRTGELVDKSARLESPQRLHYTAKWSDLFRQCRGQRRPEAVDSHPTALTPTAPSPSSSRGSNDAAARGGVQYAIETSTLQALPLAYSYDYVTEGPGFARISDAHLRAITGRSDLTDGRLRRLPKTSAVQPVLVQGTEPSGEAPMYLATLDAGYRPVARLVVYKFEEGDGFGVSTTFQIAKDLTITLTRERRTGRGKVSQRSVAIFRTQPDGSIVKSQ